MTNGQIRDLCIALLHAETEDEVIELLTKHGYWDKPELWRHYGDLENNWGQGGNQQSLAEAALVEKIVNSVDARLINECLVNGVEPKGPDAPKTIREAVARFFEAGPVRSWRPAVWSRTGATRKSVRWRRTSRSAAPAPAR